MCDYRHIPSSTVHYSYVSASRAFKDMKIALDLMYSFMSHFFLVLSLRLCYN